MKTPSFFLAIQHFFQDLFNTKAIKQRRENDRLAKEKKSMTILKMLEEN